MSFGFGCPVPTLTGRKLRKAVALGPDGEAAVSRPEARASTSLAQLCLSSDLLRL